MEVHTSNRYSLLEYNRGGGAAPMVNKDSRLVGCMFEGHHICDVISYCPRATTRGDLHLSLDRRCDL